MSDRFLNYLPQNITPEQFDPTSLTPDCISVDLKITKPSEIKLYGSVLCLFIHLKVHIHLRSYILVYSKPLL